MSATLAGVLKQKPGGAVVLPARAAKASPAGQVEGYLVAWGNPRDTDLEREYFSPRTNFCLEWFDSRPCLYHHGLDGTTGLKSIGKIKSVHSDDLGLWVQAQLDMADKYARAVYDMVKTGKFGWSSGSVEHLVQVRDNGEIATWPLIEGSITPTPAQPAKTNIYTIKSVSVDALRAALPRNDRDWLRELDARAADGIKSHTAEEIDFRRNNMSDTYFASRRLVRAVLHASGFKADPEDVDAVAADIEPVVAEEIAAGADFEEDDALMSALMADEYDDAMMEDDDALMSALMADEYDDAMMEDDDVLMSALMADEYDDAMMEDDDALMSALMADEFDDALMADEFDDALMADEFDDALMADEEEALMSYRSTYPRRRRPVRSASPRYVRQLERRLRRLERMPAPGEAYIGRHGSGIKSLGVVDSADRPGAYSSAFKAYIRKGLAGLYDQEKYVLERGRDSFGPADSATPGIKALNIGTDTSVGYGVPPDWLNELNKNIEYQAVMAAECGQRTTSSDRVIQPYLTTSDARRAYPGTAYWPGETPASGDSHRVTEMELSQIEIPVHVMLVSYTATQSSLEDVSFDLQAAINEQFAEDVAIAYDTLIWNGSGNGKMQGITVHPDVITSASTGVSSVSGYVAAGSTTEVTSGDVIKQMFMNMPARYRRNAKWYANSDTILHLAQLKDGNGQYLWDIHNNAGLRGGIPEELMGRPIVFNEFASSIAANAFPLIFGDLNKGYTVVKRVDFSVRRFDEVLADRDQVLFIGRARVGGTVTRPEPIKVLKMSAS